jgi:hypothetical protein
VEQDAAWTAQRFETLYYRVMGAAASRDSSKRRAPPDLE